MKLTYLMNSKKDIIDYLLLHMNEENQITYQNEDTHIVNDEIWTPADLFIRQYLNNNSDGFGMFDVHKIYKFLLKNKETLIKNNMINKKGSNNFGFILWENYNF